MDQSAHAWVSRAWMLDARGSHAPGCWSRVGARAAAVGDETSSWWSPVSCEAGGGVAPERRCVMAEKRDTQWRRKLQQLVLEYIPEYVYMHTLDILLKHV
ncbi:hypothetical protein TSUD_184160 [Trifolium subterraneum]|uniref:Uncharacterized protein n=1 Tax=Trifolium subterraneum TaxID=3900 RepID=A0A2Z6NXR7_TRISU|nr:hypothetical protein TSUD_184160 [Trifolium subterraneum]